jgi:hypothetical protein
MWMFIIAQVNLDVKMAESMKFVACWFKCGPHSARFISFKFDLFKSWLTDCWSSPAQWFLRPSTTGLMTIFYSGSLQLLHHRRHTVSPLQRPTGWQSSLLKPNNGLQRQDTRVVEIRHCERLLVLFTLCRLHIKLALRGREKSLQKYINKVCHFSATLLLVWCAASSFASSPLDVGTDSFYVFVWLPNLNS